METFQQPMIAGYRQLNDTEAELMNSIKLRLGNEMRQALHEVTNHIAYQRSMAKSGDTNTGEFMRLEDAQPERWAAIARTHFQEGLMALTRAVAQPGFF